MADFHRQTQNPRRPIRRKMQERGEEEVRELGMEKEGLNAEPLIGLKLEDVCAYVCAFLYVQQ